VCGRFSLGADTDRLIAEFGLDGVPDGHTPRYNIAPTQPVLAVVRGPDGLRAGSLRWGLIPAGSAEPGRPLINARAETVARRPSFAGPFRRRRCWVLADGFYEWRAGPDGSRRPIHFSLPGGTPFAFAGLWDRWEGDDEAILSCAILTTRPSAAVAPVHDRMPVILPRESRDRWLDPDAGPGELDELLAPYPDPLEARLASTRVNNPANDDLACLFPEDGSAPGNISPPLV
jgi:putative SOS response-associated peptidase YedK